MTRRASMTWMLFASLWLALQPEAHADEGEVSLHGLVQLGNARVGEIGAPGQTDTASFLGTGARATYATSNWYAWEATWSLAELVGPVQYTADTSLGETIRRWRMAWTRLDLGISARLGVRFIPTLYAAIGVQRRLSWQGRAFTGLSPHCPRGEDEPAGVCVNDLAGQAALELVGTLGAGLDYRLGDHWVAGLVVSTQRAARAEAPFHAIAATFHISYYFYPEGAEP